MGKLFTKDQLVKCLKDFSVENGTTNISKKDMDQNKSYPSSSTFTRYFGSWKNAIMSANLNVGAITGRPQNPPIIVNNCALQIITGELLGDGCLSLTGTYRSNACFSHSTSNISYGIYLYNKLKKHNVPLLSKEYLPPRNNGKMQFRTRTTSNQYWTSLYNKWYHSGVKKIPRDIILTKEICLHWYLGDGYFEDSTSKISTCGFSYEENQYLSAMLTKIGFTAHTKSRSGGYYIICFDKSSYKNFLGWIGICPVSGYEHRWGR